jgi:hypothetical protein
MAFYSRRVAVAAVGTPVRFASSGRAAWVEITADPANTGLVYVGGPETTRGTGAPKTCVGVPLLPGIWHLLRESSGVNYYDLTQLYVDADNATDAIDFVYARL